MKKIFNKIKDVVNYILYAKFMSNSDMGANILISLLMHVIIIYGGIIGLCVLIWHLIFN